MNRGQLFAVRVRLICRLGAVSAVNDRRIGYTARIRSEGREFKWGNLIAEFRRIRISTIRREGQLL